LNFRAIRASLEFMCPRLTASRDAFVPLRSCARVAFALVLAACATKQPVPVEDRVAVPAPPSAASPAPPAAAPVASDADSRAQTYTVKRGDTLAQIALDNGLDYREVAAWNNLENPNLIRVGQVLRLTAPGSAGAAATTAAATTAPLRASPPTEARPATPASAAPVAAAPTAARSDAMLKSSPKALREPYSEHALREVALASNTASAASTSASPAPAAASASAAAGEQLAMATPPGPRVEPKAEAPKAAAEAGDEDHIDWAWPAKGKVVGGFSESANLKGIDISGTAGQPVLASAPGRVVYAGNGLRGYGKPVIIKHNKTYLSAYAHNRDLLVKEGDQVTKGQKIAEMGNTDSDQVKLHFEIRRLGKPMDPARYLPPA
jgi:lipoprotein NlpD